MEYTFQGTNALYDISLLDKKKCKKLIYIFFIKGGGAGETYGFPNYIIPIIS